MEDEDKGEADLWLINTCTVKGPSQSAMSNVLKQGEEQGKKLVVTGCVPQGDRKNKELEEYSIIGKVCAQVKESTMQYTWNWK